MFSADPNKIFVPSKTVSVKPENQTEFSTKRNNQIRFHIPSYIGFCDPEHIRFQCKAKMVNIDGTEPRGNIHPDGAAGIWSTVRDLRISDGTGRTELEMVSDLNVLCAQEWGFTQNDSINGKRELFEGMSVNTEGDNQLWFGEPDDWTKKTRATNPDATQLKLTARIPCSGIIGNKAKNIYPLTATSGLRVVMNLEDFSRSMVVGNTLGVGEAVNYPGSAGVAPAAGANYKVENGEVPKTFYNVFTTKAKAADAVDTGAGKNKGVFDIEISNTMTDKPNELAALQNNSFIDNYNDNNLAIDDILYICFHDGTHPQPLGKITKMEKAGTGATQRLKITYQANRPNGTDLGTADGSLATAGYLGADGGTANTANAVVFILPEDRVNNVTLLHTADARANGGTETLSEMDIEITDCELSILQVEPPAGYVDNMLKKVNSSGVEMDYCTSTLYRGNIVNAQGMTSNLIPANQSRAYSLLTVPLTQKSQTSLIQSSLLARYEDQLSYQWVLNGNLTPDRSVDLRKYEHNKNPVLHIMENEKSMGNAKNTVRNLWNTGDRLLLGRALSRYGQVHDLQGTTTMLRITYPNTPGENVLLNNNVVHLNRMVISADGVVVVR